MVYPPINSVFKNLLYIQIIKCHNFNVIPAKNVGSLDMTSNINPKGALTFQRYTGMCHFDDPLFSGSSAAPETHLFTPSVSSYPFSVF